MFSKKDKKAKKEDVVESAPVVKEDEAPEVKEEAPVVVAKTTTEAGEVTFRSSGHTKLYAKLDPESRYAKNMVRRYSK